MSQFMMPIDNFFRAVARWPDRPAVEIADGVLSRVITYKDLGDQVNALATALQAVDAAPQSRVGICAYNSFEHLLGWLATYAAGKVWVPLNPRNGREELDRIIDLTEPSIVIFDADCQDKFGPTNAHLLLGKANADTGRAASQMMSLIADNMGQMPQIHRASPDDLQAIKFTGGFGAVITRGASMISGYFTK